MLLRHFKRFKFAYLTLLLGAGIWYAFCLPAKLFDVPYSTVILSADGQLLDAHIASDEQWRFPAVDSIPEKYKKAVLLYEDDYFYQHPGVNPISMIKAVKQNQDAGKIVRGGSTITQQVIRLARKNKRTYTEKLIEAIWATRLEFRLSKERILELYASHAPFGGNVVGLDMAAWRYFGRQPHQLSWAESATLAVLPNAPGLIYPGKREHQLKKKRDDLLSKMHQEGLLSAMEYELALLEDLPLEDFKIPHRAPHLLHRIAREQGHQKVKTTLSNDRQQQAEQIVANHHHRLSRNGVHNIAMLVLDIDTQSVVAYVGNAPTSKAHGKDVDVIPAPRSTGSVLKPFLYASMLDDGVLLPNSLVIDIPTVIDGYRTENYDRQYRGAIPASGALAQSLNVPAVRMLRDYGVPRLYNRLQELDLKHINRGHADYGLSLIIGGAESSLWDISKAYLSMAYDLKNYSATSSLYNPHSLKTLTYLQDQAQPARIGATPAGWVSQANHFNAGSIHHTFEAMKSVNRPEGEAIWHFFHPDKEIAWKTGTSFGNRDAWAVGVTSKYVIGVWTGNADGEGRADMTGIDSAAPILFDYFNQLPTASWFATPHDALEEVVVCSKSGYLASPICPSKKELVPPSGKRYDVCPYHQLLSVNKEETYQINYDCAPNEEMKQKTYFVLPPSVRHYYSQKNLGYSAPPPVRPDCILEEQAVVRMIYPRHHTQITNTLDINGRLNPIIFEAAHQSKKAQLFWYMNDTYIGQTKGIHQKAISAPAGNHRFTIVDELGNDQVIFIEFK